MLTTATHNEHSNASERIRISNGIFTPPLPPSASAGGHCRPRRWRRPQHAATACRSGAQQGVARQCAVWTGRAGWARLRTEGSSEVEGLGTARREKLGGEDRTPGHERTGSAGSNTHRDTESPSGISTGTRATTPTLHRGSSTPPVGLPLLALGHDEATAYPK
jgi:hypothetical protein